MKKRVGYLLSLVLFLGFSESFSQSSTALTSDGRDFFIGHMPSSNRCTNTTKYMGVWALVTSQFNATVTISYFDDQGREQPGTTYSIPKNSSRRIKLTTQAMELNDRKGESSGEFKSCHIQSNAPIAVQYYTTGPNSCGMYSSIPTNALGKEYVVQTWWSNPGNGIGTSGYACPKDSSASEFMIIAPFDSTNVTIYNTGRTMKGKSGICYGKDPTGDTSANFTVKLRRGQCYMVKSTFYDDQNSMDGSYIKSDKPIAVLSAQENAINGKPNINNVLYEDIRDLMVEQMTPVESWSDGGYYSMPLRDSGPRDQSDKSLGELYRIYVEPFEDNLEEAVQFNTADGISQTKGISPYCGYVQQNNVETGVAIASKNGKRIGVAMFDYRQQNQNQPFPAPSQMTVIPASSWKKFYSWMVPDDQIIAVRNFFVNIIANKDSLTGGKILISVNGGPGRSANSFPAAGGYADIPGRPDLIGKRIIVGPGSYSLFSNTPCAVYHYGMEAFDLDGDLGDNEGDDFYFGYASPVGQSFGKGQGHSTVSAIEDCSGWEVTIKDSSEGIASVEMLDDVDGLILGKPYVSNNTQLQPLNYVTVPGSKKEYIRIQVKNPFNDAVAYLHIINRSGKDTLIIYKYTAPKISLKKEEGGNTRQDFIGFKPTLVSTQICSYFVLRNLDTAKDRSIQIKKVVQILKDKDIKITNITPPISDNGETKLLPGDSLKIEVCYTASDTGITHFDSILIKTGCFDVPLYVEGRGITPLIRATDYTFPDTKIGDTICKTVKVQNVGGYDLTVSKQYLLKDSINFSIYDEKQLPVVLKPGQSLDLGVCFHPQKEGLDSSSIKWINDIPLKYQGSVKDYSILKGTGIKVGLTWDRAKQLDTVPINFSKIIRVYLINSSTATTFVDSVVIVGQDKAEYKIIDNDAHRDPLAKFNLGSEDSLWVDIQFSADTNKPNKFANRRMTLVAFSGKDIIRTIDFETVLTSFSAVQDRTASLQNFSIYPNPLTDNSLTVHLSEGGNRLSTFRIYDQLGKLIAEDKITVTNGNGILQLPIENMQAGLYYVQFTDKGKIYSEKLWIKK